uniref:Retrovirus-related Pol polyprotein from transposon TNT 1-94 n=1 Tax=Tanacetum cinerariifolium TaxID=118510 RepID=A0A6L2NHS1_TANCI|nr:retrovirus-related Pol polyprotein from transposon TNT 1-94 [Tanacetum cinerariifolium]
MNAANMAGWVTLQEIVFQKFSSIISVIFSKQSHPRLLSSSQHKPKIRPTKDFEAKYNKVKAKLALMNSSALVSKSSMVKNIGLVAKSYEWDEEDVSSDDNETTKVTALMPLADDKNLAVGKESAKNSEWVKISI